MTPDIYVSTVGNDFNSGGINSPLLTLSKAQTQARTLATALGRGITIGLGSGTYFQTATLALTSSDNNLSIIGTGETPSVISGGIQITNWSISTSSKNIWSASLSNFTRDVWVNGQRAYRSNNSIGLPSGSTVNGTAGYTTGTALTYSNSLHTNNISNIEFVTRDAWTESRVAVSSISGTAVTMVQPAQKNFVAIENDMFSTVPLVSWIENAWEDFYSNASSHATVPTFYWDSYTGTLYLNPLDGQDPNLIPVIAGQLTTVITITGQNITLGQGISVSHTTWNGANGTTGYTDMQTGVYCASTGFISPYSPMPKMPSAVSVTASGFQSNAYITRLGTSGIVINAGSNNCKLIGGIFADVAGVELYVGDPLDWNSSNPATNITVQNNYFTKPGAIYHDCCAITGFYASNCTISNNLIQNTPYTGINWGWGWSYTNFIPNSSANNIIENNSIQNVMNVMGDGGGIYMCGQQNGLICTGNWINGSRSMSGTYNNGLYFENGSYALTATNNLMENCQEGDMAFGPPFGNIVVSGNYMGDGPSSVNTAYLESQGLGTNGSNGANPLNGSQGAAYTWNLSLQYVNTVGSLAQAIRNNAGLQSAYQYLTTVKW